MRLLLVTVLTCSLLSVAHAGEGSVDFARDIKPILADKCFACHGPDAEQRQGGLRLDTREGALADLGGYQAIVAGDVEASELVRRVNTTDADEVMPPAEHRKSLTATEKELLTEWIGQGARWSQHWAYVAPQASYQRTGNWIDDLIHAKLASLDLTPSPRAEKHVLLRRVYFDLIGLPPKPADVDAFLADQSEEAWEKVVDQLLASPHFGERMAIYWLDLVRYADTVGYHGDQDVSISPYRDYVIDAFNANLPFDQFTREQLAGDLLPNPTQNQLIASGYNKLGMMSAEGGAQPKEYLAKYASDRVRTASTVWLGSTLGCAECHDHKFDPFTQKDFYQFAAFFADIQERGLYSGANRDGNWGPRINIPDDVLPELLKPIDARIVDLTKQYETTDISASMVAWEDSLATNSDWQTLVPAKMEAMHNTILAPLEDHSILASGPNASTNTYTLTLEAELAGVSGFRVEVLPHDSLPAKGPGRAGNGNFVLSEFRVSLSDGQGNRKRVELVNAQASFEQADGNKKNPYQGWKAAAAIDHDKRGKTWGWAVMPQFGVANQWVAELKEPLTQTGATQLIIELDQNHDNPGHTIGRFRVSVTRGKVQLDSKSQLPAEIRNLLASAVEIRTDEQHRQLAEYYRSVAPELSEVRKQLAAAKSERKAIEDQHTRSTLITKAVEPRTIRVLPRGNWMDDSGEVVQPGVPSFLPQIETEGRATRLDLAAWLTSPENPLTARVFVNRMWKLMFGGGLSKVLDDIGSQGEFPTHPLLLDELALEFVESGWNVKQLLKQIVMSETYRQSSLMDERLRELDPYNRLLARQSRFRLDAEMIRDNVLAVSGLLVTTIGGRSVKPYQPAGLLRHLNFPARTYQHDSGDNQYRRGVYTHWQRQFLHPAMKSFDAPSREECTAARPRSNTPLAALVMLNDPSYVEAARVFAQRLLKLSVQNDKERFEAAFRDALSRSPTDHEYALLTELLESQRKQYLADSQSVDEVLSVGLQDVPTDLERAELAAWLSICRVIFNMHEFITRN